MARSDAVSDAERETVAGEYLAASANTPLLSYGGDARVFVCRRGDNGAVEHRTLERTADDGEWRCVDDESVEPQAELEKLIDALSPSA